MKTRVLAILVALGNLHAGLFCNDDDLADKLLSAGLTTRERLWRMPLDKAYDEHLDSRIADIKHHAEDSESGDAPHVDLALEKRNGDSPRLV